MKIPKIALSFLAIAISSSAFASSSFEQMQNCKQEILNELNTSTYDVVNNYAYANLSEGMKGAQNPTEIIVHTDDLSNDYAALTINDLINRINALKKERSLQNSMTFSLSEKDKLGFSGNELADFETSTKKIISDNLVLRQLSSLNSDQPELPYSASQLFNYTRVLQDRKGSSAVVSHLYGALINKEITMKEFIEFEASLREYEKAKNVSDLKSVNTVPTAKAAKDYEIKEIFGMSLSPVEEITVVAPARELLKIKSNFVELMFPSDESVTIESSNSKSISEFNALQELALKESDPAVKGLIKQAADFKLAGYRK
ncbi:hypothetical protein ABEH28_13365 [Pseudomonas sp. Ps21-P2]|uniref:hypothetical protein n=1 Tax=Pseudomonas sp. Ps21-P2 TaxID=3080331 RepID=UPI003207AFD0